MFELYTEEEVSYNASKEDQTDAFTKKRGAIACDEAPLAGEVPPYVNSDCRPKKQHLILLTRLKSITELQIS